MNILVVEDDQSLCLTLSRFLEKHGYVVHSASDALQALDILERNVMDMIITDFMMPVIDGIGMTDRIRKDPRHQTVPVIMLTAHPDSKALEAGLRKGVSMTLSKPVDLDQLLNLVRFAE